uniref:Uncharacterized protein n=1 Tax=Rhizophora mucronata TaxID=61149 RepID=A0A2P2R213_RHIMU
MLKRTIICGIFIPKVGLPRFSQLQNYNPLKFSILFSVLLPIHYIIYLTNQMDQNGSHTALKTS